MGCKRSRVQISAARPNSSKSYRQWFLSGFSPGVHSESKKDAWPGRQLPERVEQDPRTHVGSQITHNTQNLQGIAATESGGDAGSDHFGARSDSMFLHRQGTRLQPKPDIGQNPNTLLIILTILRICLRLLARVESQKSGRVGAGNDPLLGVPRSGTYSRCLFLPTSLLL